MVKKDFEGEKGFFGIFKKKPEEVVIKQEKPVLSETVIKDINDSNVFLDTEVNKYHDVKPIISDLPTTVGLETENVPIKTEVVLEQTVTVEAPTLIKDIQKEESTIQVTTVEKPLKKKKDKDSDGGLFGIFKKKTGSLERDVKTSITETDTGKLENPVLSESTVKEMTDSTNFLQTEIDKYHDVRPTIPHDFELEELPVAEIPKTEQAVKVSKEGKGIFGIFKKRSGSADREVDEKKKIREPIFGKPKKPEKPVLSETTIKDMQDSNVFLQTEVDKYHDVKPLAVTEVSVEKIEKSVKEIDAKPITTETVSVIVSLKTDEPLGKTEQPVSVETAKEKSPKKKKDKPAESEKAGIFGIFKKKVGTLERDATPKPAGLSEITVKEMEDSTNFLETEINKYHDVRPKIDVVDTTIAVEEPVVHDVKPMTETRPNESLLESIEKELRDKTTQNIQKVEEEFKEIKPAVTESITITKEKLILTEPSVKEESSSPKKLKEKKSGLFGIFKKKDQESEISDEVKQNMDNSQSFLVTEVDKFQDVRPIEVPTESAMITKVKSPEMEDVKVTETIETITTSFPLEKHLDDITIKNIVVESEPTDKEDLTFKESLQEATKNSDAFIRQEVEKFHDVRPVVAATDEAKTTEEAKLKEPKPKEAKSGFFGIFKKKGSEERDTQLTEEKISKKIQKESKQLPHQQRPKLSGETMKAMSDSNSFLVNEVEVYHDVRPIVTAPAVVSETPIKEETHKDKEQKKGGFFDKFKRKSEDRELKRRSGPSEETLKHMLDSQSFIQTEIQKFHDVRPTFIPSPDLVQKEEVSKTVLSQTEAAKDVKTDEDEKKREEKAAKDVKTDKDEKKRKDKRKDKGFFDIFKKKGSESYESDTKPKDGKIALSEDVIKSMKDSDNFLTGEVDKYHDVRPIQQVSTKIATKPVSEDKESKASPSKISKQDTEQHIVITEKHFVKEGGYLNEVFVKETTEKKNVMVEAQDVGKNLHETSNFLNTELDVYEDGTIKKEKVTKNDVQPQLSAETLSHMLSTSDFIRDEVSNYHDVKPVLKTEEPEKEKEKSKKLFGLFSKKKSPEKDTESKQPNKDEPQSSDKKLKDETVVTESKDFSRSEIDRFPQEVRKSKEDSGSFFGLFSKKTKPQEKEKSVDKEIPQQLSQTVVEDMKHSSDFLTKEVDLYHDVKPQLDESFNENVFEPVTLSPIHIPDTEFTLTSERIQQKTPKKSKEDASFDRLYETLKDESPKRTVTTTVTKQSLPSGERVTKVKEELITGTIQLGPEVLDDIEKLEKEINAKLEEIRHQTGDYQDPTDIVSLQSEVTEYSVNEEVREQTGDAADLFGKRMHSELPDIPVSGRISELSFDEPSPSKERKLNAEILRQMQQSHSFLTTEIENYDDGKPEIVTDLDEDQKVKSTGLFGIFSKKEKSVSPNVPKKKFRKSKESKSLEEPEKVGLIEKIGRKLTGGKYELEEASKNVSAVEVGILTKKDGFVDSTVDKIEDSVKQVEKDVLDSATTVKIEAKSFQDATKEKIKETEEEVKTLTQDKTKQIKEGLKTVEDKSSELSKETVDKASKKSPGFFGKLGEKVHGKSEDKDKPDKKEKKPKKSGFLSKLGGKSSKEVSFETPEVTTVIESTLPHDIKTEISDNKNDVAKSDSANFVNDLLQSFDDKLENVKDNKDDLAHSSEEVMKEFEQRTENIKKGVSDIAAKQEEKLKETVKDTDKELEKRTESIKKSLTEMTQKSTEKITEIKRTSEKKLKEQTDSFEKTIDEKFSETMKLSEELSKITKDDVKKASATMDQLEYQKRLIEEDVNRLEEEIKQKRQEVKDKLDDELVYAQKAIRIEKSKLETMDRDIRKKIEKSEKIEMGIASTVQNVEDAASISKPDLAKEIEKIEADITTELDSLKITLEDTAKQVQDAKSKTTESVKESIKETGKQIEHTAKTKAETVSTSIKDTTDQAKSTVMSKVETISTSIKETSDETKSSVKSKVESMSTTIKDTTNQAKEAVTTKVDEMKVKTEEINEKAKQEQQKLKEDVKETADKASKKGKGFFDKLGKKITGKKDEVKEAAKETSTKVETAVDTAAEEVATKSKSVFGKLGKKLSGKGDELKSAEAKTDEKLKQQVEATTQAAETVIFGEQQELRPDVRQQTVDFLESESRRTDDSKMSRAVSDYGSQLKKSVDDGSRQISEANIDLSNIPTDDDKYLEKTDKSTPYVTSPKFSRRTFSAKITKSGKPEVIEVSYETNIDGHTSSDKYIVSEPDDARVSTKKPLFHIESEEADDSKKSSSKFARSESSSSNVLETLTESRIESLLSDLTKDLSDSTKPIQTSLKTEEKRLEAHKKESEAEVDLIERKLRDLDKALDSLEQVEIVETIEETRDNHLEKKLRRVERKFERMASDVIEKESTAGKIVQMTSPEIEIKRETEYQTLVSQLSTEDISEFQKEFSHMWDEHTFSKSSDRESKTPDSQADAQELPQGAEQPASSSSAREVATSSSTRSEGEEGAEKDESGYERSVADQHQLSEEMKELLKELEKESKQ